MADNYPDDIRMYDHDPRSPFYEEPMIECQLCENFYESEHMADDNYCLACAKEIMKEDGEIE